MQPRVAQLHFGHHVHPIYREQMHSVPTGWTYASANPDLLENATETKRIAQHGWRTSINRLAEQVGGRVLSELGYVHRVTAKPLSEATIIHSCERLLRNSPLPYVLDLEHVLLFTIYQRAALERPWARRLLYRSLEDDRLRLLLAWSEAARRSVLEALPDRIAARVEPKLRVVSPAIRPSAQQPRRRGSGPLRVVFIGTAFVAKGGVAAVQALREVRKRHDVTLDIVSFVPDNWVRRLAGEPGLTLHAPGSRDLIHGLYRDSDVLLFPSHMDTYGYVILEAMAYGLPVVAPDHLAYAESVQRDVSGLLFRPENMIWLDDTTCRLRHIFPVPLPRGYLRQLENPSPGYVSGITAALTQVAENEHLYNNLAQGALESVTTGHLSVSRRKSLLREAYDLAAGGATA